MAEPKVMRGAPGRSQLRAVNYLFEQGCSIQEVSDRLCIEVEGLEPYAPAKSKASQELADMMGDAPEKPAPKKKASKKKVTASA